MWKVTGNLWLMTGENQTIVMAWAVVAHRIFAFTGHESPISRASH
jgi:hypothetical protein